MNEIPEQNQTPISVPKDNANHELDFSKLTHQNWLFINAFLATGSTTKAYQMAKYEGRDASAPYQIFKKLKTYIEQIGDLDVTSRARLQADIKSVLDLPLDPDKKTLSIGEWLKVRKFAASITPEATKSKQQISVLVINRPSKQTIKVDQAGNERDKGDEKVSTHHDTSPEITIDVTPIP